MLSFRTIIAIQLIRVLRDAGSRGLNVAELKVRSRINNSGVNHAARLLKERGWTDYGPNNRYRLAICPEQKTLYDLVMAIDGEIRLDTHIVLPHWGYGARERLPEAVRVDGRLEEDFSAALKGIKVSDLIKDVEPPKSTAL